MTEEINYPIYRDVKVVTPLATKHPKVSEIWETGSCSADPNDKTMYYHINFLLRGGGRADFKGIDPKYVLEEAQQWLNNLPIH